MIALHTASRASSTIALAVAACSASARTALCRMSRSRLGTVRISQWRRIPLRHDDSADLIPRQRSPLDEEPGDFLNHLTVENDELLRRAELVPQESLDVRDSESVSDPSYVRDVAHRASKGKASVQDPIRGDPRECADRFPFKVVGGFVLQVSGRPSGLGRRGAPG